MSSVIAFWSAYKVEILAIAYFALVLLTHVPGPVADVAKWLLAGKIIQPPANPPSA